MQPVATLRTPPSSSWEVPTLSSLNLNKGNTLGKPLDSFAPLVQDSQQVSTEPGRFYLITKDTARPTTTEERPIDYYVEHIRKQAEEATDFDSEGCDELEAAVAVLTLTDLRSSSPPKVSVELLPGAVPDKVEILITVYEKAQKLDESFVRSLNDIAGKCVDFAKEFRAALHTKGGGPVAGRVSRDPLNEFIRNTLLPAIIEHHSSTLFNMLPALTHELTKAWNEIKSLPPLRIRPIIYRIITELNHALNENESAEKRRVSLANAIMKCVELLEDRNEMGISIVERSWGKRYPTLCSNQKAQADPELKAILSYAPGEQTLLDHIVDIFLFDTVGQNKNVPDINHGERPICPITRTAIKLARLARAAQLIAESMIDMAYQANDFSATVVVVGFGHWWGGGGEGEGEGARKGLLAAGAGTAAGNLGAGERGNLKRPGISVLQVS